MNHIRTSKRVFGKCRRELQAKSLYAYYQKALKEDELDLFIVGDFKEEEVLSTINQILAFDYKDSKNHSTNQCCN